MRLHHKLIFGFFIFFITHTFSWGQTQDEINQLQNMSPAQMSSFNVDDLSDAQIRRYQQMLQQSGYSEAEVEAYLLSRGMSQSQISKLRSRISGLGTSQPQTGQGFNRSRSYKEPTNTRDDLYSALTEDYDKIVSEERKRIFGYRLFNSEYLTFEPNLNIPTPTDYLLGTGDEVIIDVWGASEQTYRENISPDGYIKIPSLGPIYLNGLTIQRATERIKSRLTQIYSGISPAQGRPNTFAQVSLGQLRTIRVHVIGEAERPGTYNVSSLSTVAHALYLSGGPNYNGSMRKIQIVRQNKVFTTVDVYEFLMKGTLKNNVTLKDGDIVRIRPYVNRIEITGEVKREGIFEALDGEKLSEVLEYAGGFTENAYREIIKARRNQAGEKIFADLQLEELDEIGVMNGDELIVQAILERYANRVQIVGAVFREGEYELTEDLTISKLIKLAEGLRGDAFMERGLLFRTNEDYSYSVIPFNIREILKGQQNQIVLKREDVIKISSIYDLQDEFYVTIDGEVKKSGTYPYFQNMTVEDLIIRAGGLRESASGSKVEIARRNDPSQAGSNTNQLARIFTIDINKDLHLVGDGTPFLLEPFDQIYIRQIPGFEPQVTAKVEGEVIYPGLYALEKKNERISDLLKRAGGISSDGYPQGATLIRRTEFNPPKSNEQIRLENLYKLLQSVKESPDRNELTLETEAEILQQKRLQDIEDQLKNYQANEDASIGREGLRVKRDRLNLLIERDSLIMENSALRYETIGIDLDRILSEPGSKYDLILQDGDIISVPKQLQTVRMRGEFLYPITVRYDDGLKFKDYISKAGGFTENARKRKAYVLYANGSVDRTKKFIFWNNYPKVDAGAEIIVPQKPEKQPMTPQAWIALSTSIATFALVIQQLTR